MQIHLDVPEDVAQQFAAQPGGVTRAAIEKLTTYQARQLLGIRSRYEMDGFLKDHGVFPPTTVDEIIRDRETAKRPCRS
jgi:hypothetical protein